MNLDFEPAWPWSALVGMAIVLAALTVWTYLGVKKATWRRVAIFVALRLLALVVALSLLIRPSFATTQLEGVDFTKLLFVVDRSESMKLADIEGQPSRWEQVNKLWASRAVQRQLERLKAEQKIEIVKYLGAGDLRPDDPTANADGKRTDIGAWLHELQQKHGHEKHLRGIVLISDGADNGTKFSAQEKARQWRGIALIQAFGVGNPDDPRYRKDIALTGLTVADSLVPAKTKFIASVIVQSPGFKGAEVEVAAVMEKDGKTQDVGKIAKFHLKAEKDQRIDVECTAPDDPGEYKLTLTITKHEGEATHVNNEISTFVPVIKDQIRVLWVDRQRVYEQKLAIDEALAPERRFKIREVKLTGNETGDALKFYGLDQEHFDVIIIGDISAKQFSFGDKTVFDKIKQSVKEKKVGLLMLGGSETFVKGGWDKETAILDLLPVKLDVQPADADFSKLWVRAKRSKDGMTHPLLILDADPKTNNAIWDEKFGDLEGLAQLGKLAEGATELLTAPSGKIIMAARQYGTGKVVVFAADSTWSAWLPGDVPAYKRFWRQLVFWLAQDEDRANQLWIKLDNRRLNANAGEVLDFTFGLKDKNGDVAKAVFAGKVIGPDNEELPVSLQNRSGAFQGPKQAGEHQLVITSPGSEARAEARFLVTFDDIEMLRPAADHDTLRRIAGNAEGRFQVLTEETLLAYLEEVAAQVNRESRHKTTHWPDWRRVPASDQPRDQLAGLWHSFALVSFLLFTALVGCEWLLRRIWGLV